MKPFAFQSQPIMSSDDGFRHHPFQRDFRRPKRPINKSMINVDKDGVDGTQVETVLITATFPGTMTGLRWNIHFTQDAGTALCEWAWAIIIAYQDETIDTVGSTDAATFYAPEKNCLVMGRGAIENNEGTIIESGKTKTMRKMQVGDRLVFLIKGVATNTTHCQGTIQFFMKT